MIRSLLATALVLVFVGLAAIFAALNPGRISLDFAFLATEMEVSLAIIGAVAVGWAFGIVCALFGILRLITQRRSLRRALRLAEQEVQALRSLPVQDAD
ncbi:MAG: lipopolysaccharide assembly protein LapA domain-containing protein [Gammaproteobacteria bacterium]|nr:lipopolysaccharide assembly protein LapA domain-containing protein [Gammaproteobacteria bacterium]MDH5275613.1 lipopolysaccharide assembly protein LapA domain-containing protein [Gammaproteobacteria bacterium]